MQSNDNDPREELILLEKEIQKELNSRLSSRFTTNPIIELTQVLKKVYPKEHPLFVKHTNPIKDGNNNIIKGEFGCTIITCIIGFDKKPKQYHYIDSSLKRAEWGCALKALHFIRQHVASYNELKGKG